MWDENISLEKIYVFYLLESSSLSAFTPCLVNQRTTFMVLFFL